MRIRRIGVTGMALLALGMSLGACSGPRVVSRAAEPGLGLLSRQEGAAVSMRDYKVVDVRVNVPESLTVSEANSLIPQADIVWHGDPYGDRRAQIATVIRDGMMAGARNLEGARPVIVEIEVARFHALTPRARYTVGGNHNIDFWMTVRDAESGEVLEPRRFVDTDLPAYGGTRAVEAEARGETQKVRIQTFMAEVLQRELGAQVAGSAGQAG